LLRESSEEKENEEISIISTNRKVNNKGPLIIDNLLNIDNPYGVPNKN
jgi:hypothetical protein